MRPLHNKGYAAARREQFIFELKVFAATIALCAVLTALATWLS